MKVTYEGYLFQDNTEDGHIVVTRRPGALREGELDLSITKNLVELMDNHSSEYFWSDKKVRVTIEVLE